jgi:hypothetical protein
VEAAPARPAGASRGCAPAPEAAPPLGDPRPEEGLRLVTRDDAGSADRTEGSLDELAGAGASIVLAGLDGETADRALRWGEEHGVPVMALAQPAQTRAAPAFGFLLGEPRETVLAALARAVPALAGETVAPLIDGSEVPLYPAQGGSLGPMTLAPPVSCEIPPTRAGEPRFPLAQWELGRTHAWLVSGSTICARDLLGELSASRARGIVALTLEAAALPVHPSSLRVVTASAGIVPEVGGGAGGDAAGGSGAGASGGGSSDDEIARFHATLGTLTWWTALGRDAATLARVALDRLPDDTVGEAKAVTDRRASTRDALAGARTRLWTSESASWSDHALRRTVCAIEAPAR